MNNQILESMKEKISSIIQSTKNSFINFIDVEEENEIEQIKLVSTENTVNDRQCGDSTIANIGFHNHNVYDDLSDYDESRDNESDSISLHDMEDSYYHGLTSRGYASNPEIDNYAEPYEFGR